MQIEANSFNTEHFNHIICFFQTNSGDKIQKIWETARKEDNPKHN